MYLDPGFGGMLIQIIVALVVAGGAIVFSLRKKIRALFSKDNTEKDSASRTERASDSSEADVVDMLSDDEQADS